MSLKIAVFGLLALSASRLTTCRSPGETGGDASAGRSDKVVALKGIDTSALTARERADWSGAVSELLSPCSDQPVSIEQCVNESRACSACAPAARYLVEQVRRGRTRAQVDAAYRARFGADQVKTIDIGDSPSKGAPNAPVVIVEFADFECPACGDKRPLLDKLVEEHAGKLRLVFKNYPLPMHQNAEKAARAGIAAHRQGKFWQLHPLLFDNQTDLSPGSIEKLAQKAGLDLARFRQDRDSEATADAVQRDRKQGEALNIDSTPSLFINGRKFPGSPDFDQDLKDWLELEFELTRGSAPTAVPPPSASVSAGPPSSAPAPSAAPSSAPAAAPPASVRPASSAKPSP
ncbi:MAG TPA: thioredoxin domain-containing protein [Polyangiaceae bacterium]